MSETRKLTTILAADVAGYSRLTAADEEGTVARLRALRHELVDPVIAANKGRTIKTTGDGWLTEFGSVVDAVRCAVEVQRKMATWNADFAPDRRIAFRVGIHLGDVIVESDGDLMGDSVNVAARLEGIAEPGGICLSNAVREQVQGKIAVNFVDLGDRQLKNIGRPIRVYSVGNQDVPFADIAKTTLTLPDKPSIAVLPFQNMSGDPEQDYLIDGIVEDIITALSRMSGLFVIARNSSFTYKGRTVDVRRVGQELGVRYVLEGSMRRAAGRVRFTCQLVEAGTGSHVWADRFDGDSADIFDLQDRITESVAAALEPNIRRAEIARAKAKPTESLDARDLFLRAQANFYLRTRASLEEAASQLSRALAIDPDYALARAHLARIYQIRNLHGWGEPADPALAIALACDAIVSDDNDPETLRSAGHVLGAFGEHERALAAVKRAVAFNSNSAPVLFSTAWVHGYACEPEPAIEYFKRAIRLSPADPAAEDLLGGLGFAYLVAGRYTEAEEVLSRAAREMPGYGPTYRHLIVALVELGRIAEARDVTARLMRADPDYRNSTHHKLYRDEEFLKRYINALKRAGVPD